MHERVLGCSLYTKNVTKQRPNILFINVGCLFVVRRQSFSNSGRMRFYENITCHYVEDINFENFAARGKIGKNDQKLIPGYK